MKSGMLAAQATFSALTAAAPENTPSSRQQPMDISSYQAAMEESYVWDELRDSRNIRPGYAVMAWSSVFMNQLDGVINEMSGPAQSFPVPRRALALALPCLLCPSPALPAPYECSVLLGFGSPQPLT